MWFLDAKMPLIQDGLPPKETEFDRLKRQWAEFDRKFPKSERDKAREVLHLLSATCYADYGHKR